MVSRLDQKTRKELRKHCGPNRVSQNFDFLIMRPTGFDQMHPKHLILFLGLESAAHADTKMTVGDGLIEGARIKPYQLEWHQCSLQEGQWQNQAALREELVVIGDSVLRHRQLVSRSDGVVRRSDTYFERASFAPLRTEAQATKAGDRLAYGERILAADGYSGFSERGETTKMLQGTISSNMLHGAAMGLPMAAMDYQDTPVEFVASMIGIDGTYDVIAEWVGKEAMTFGENDIEAWLIDVEWHHRESGDVYPTGPGC